MTLQHLFARALPAELTYADELTVSGRRLVTRVIAGVAAVALGIAGIWLLEPTSWKEVTAGALLAWGVSAAGWSTTSYRSATNELRSELRRQAELDLVHARLNQLASHVGAPLLDLDRVLDSVVRSRAERLAHFAGLDEFRAEPSEFANSEFWTQEALGSLDDSGDNTT